MYLEDIKELTKENSYFRRVLHTGEHSQVVAMSIPKNGDIGMESHPSTDQILVIVHGVGDVIINDEKKSFEKHDVIFVPAGATHNFINTGEDDLKLFTIYAPPEHADGTIHKTKQEAVLAEKE
jgi:mannose-6-phosphate isomerase-like protein (cupin superfamily)